MWPCSSERCRGAILGLAAGDRNGGPIRMALMAVQNVVDSSASERTVDILRCGVFDRYYNWWDPDQPAEDKAFDTGATIPRVFSAVKRHGSDPSEEAVAVDSAGINGAHRTVLLACCKGLEEGQLVELARADTRLTHGNHYAIEAAAASAVVLRRLILGESMEAALQAARAVCPDLQTSLDLNSVDEMAGIGGYAPAALAAAVYLVKEHENESFDVALRAILQWAGPDNYSPVIAAAWLGAIHGGDQVSDVWIEDSRMLRPSKQYSRQDMRSIIRAKAEELGCDWR
eukprot:TRINITY_DN33472_c0_g1_i1.p1 TRINITY_DN33472_c0_g1~~TRINITY_DN33472_c0_g1_i1.p1  ORF type:complete len:286 (-),score=46.32 TRINITY_DN33472_c0_g1_i1:116-973(-)